LHRTEHTKECIERQLLEKFSRSEDDVGQSRYRTHSFYLTYRKTYVYTLFYAVINLPYHRPVHTNYHVGNCIVYIDG